MGASPDRPPEDVGARLFRLYGLDVLIDADARPLLIEAIRKPALTTLVQCVSPRFCRTVFEMGYAFDAGLSAYRIATLAKDRAALLQREVEHKAAHKGLIELLV
jgi:hypothetical protein